MLRFNLTVSVSEWDDEKGATEDFEYTDNEKKALRETIANALDDLPIDIFHSISYPTGRVDRDREFVIGLSWIKDG